MKRIDIFIETSIKGPTQRTGVVGYVIEYITKKEKEVTLSKVWNVADMNEHTSLLTAAISAMKRLKPGNEIVIHTDAAWMVTSINEWLKKWERMGWVTGKGGEVKHKELYIQMAEKKKTDILVAEKGIGAKYGYWLTMQVQKEEEKLRCAK